jgi:O-antigen ligase
VKDELIMNFFPNNNFFSNYYIIIPILLFPFFFISGPFLPDFVISISSIFFLIYCFKNKDFKYFNNYYFLLFFVIYIYLNINSFFSFDQKISFKTSIPYIRFIIFAAFFSFLINKKYFIKFFFLSFYLSYIVLLIDSLVQLKIGFNLIGYPAFYRISSFFGDELIMGSFVSRTLPFILGILFYLNIKNKELLSLILLLISGILVFISGERLSLVYYVITAIFFSFFFFKFKFKFYFFTLIFILFSVITFYNSNFFNRLYFHTKEQLKQGRSVFFLSYRHELHYLSAYRMFKDKKIFGHGLRSFRNLCSDEKYNVQDKINKDNAKISPIDGFYNIAEKYRVVEDLNLSKSVQKYYVISVSSKNSYVEFIAGDSYVKFYKSNGDSVKKNETLFVSYGYSNGCNTHPHNIYLQILAEIGLVGFFLFFGFFLFMFYQLIIIFLRIKRNNIAYKDKSNFLFILGIVLSLFPLFPSGSFYNNWLLSIFSINLGFLINYYPLTIKKND